MAITESPGCKLFGNVRILERNFHGNPLHDFREIAGRVVGWHKCELRAAGRSNLLYFAVDQFPRIFVDANFRRVADFHIGQLRFAIVRQNPLDERHEGDNLRSRRYKLPGPDLPLADGAVIRRLNRRVAEIYFCADQCGFFGVQVSDKLYILRLQYSLGAPLALLRVFAAAQACLCLLQICLPACKLG